MKPDALVFDLDGTLWDAAAASTDGWNLALEEMGFCSRVDIAGIRSVSGTPFVQCVETLLPELSPPSEATVSALDAGERAMLEATGGVLCAGVADGLRRLAALYPLFLVSNCPDWYLEAFLRMHDLRECFAAWDCYGSSGVAKSGMLLDLSKRYRLEHAIYVGDTQGDRDAAEAAGMEFAFVRYGFGRTEAPSLAFDSFAGLVAYFVSLSG